MDREKTVLFLCPATPAGAQRLHWPLDDPARAVGNEEEVMVRFREVRDEIRRRVETLAAMEAVQPRAQAAQGKTGE